MRDQLLVQGVDRLFESVHQDQKIVDHAARGVRQVQAVEPEASRSGEVAAGVVAAVVCQDGMDTVAQERAQKHQLLTLLA
ncbi:hypothetical protein AB5J72_01055 [Streptomyces sp. CG1]|uniref:hypothetical protein n=1 Tax=Streptomyces sp. CG1 TaxID=1287523 RepID=UPI0034E1C24C